MSLTTIKNDKLEVVIDSYGAELASIKCNDGKERLWQGDAKFWGNRAPVLFPIVSRLTNNKYTYNGTEYEMFCHGFASHSEFELESAGADRAVFLLCSDDKTRACYPFDFEFRVDYYLEGNSLCIGFDIRNMTDGDMYFSTGSHEGLSCPGGVSNYSIVFDETEESLDSLIVDKDRGVLSDTYNVGKNTREIKLRDDYFTVDALIFLNLKSNGLSVRDDRTGESVHIDFTGFDTILIWSKCGAPYVCIEPWSGCPDLPDHPYSDFSEKYRINKLQKGESRKYLHKLTF